MKINISSKQIGHNSPCFIIAEGCDNHLGDLGIAKQMAYEAYRSGADAIKFQHHLPDEEMLPDAPMSDNFKEPLYDFLLKHALTIEEHRILKKYCDEIGIIYLCTPFSLKAAYEINDIVPAFKIGSGEMTDLPTITRISDLKKPMIASTGMSTFSEIDRTYESLIKRDVQLVLMNCVSEYPPIYEDINLKVISKMKERYPQALIGHSDHTPDLYTSFAAVALGATVIEKHVIIDKKQPGPDQPVSIDFDELSNLVDGVRKIEVSMGDEKKIHDKEKKVRTWAFRSIVSTRPISRGEIIEENAIWSKRPGTGIPAHEMDKVIGCRAKRVIASNEQILWDDLERC